jgi:hypothetical protein
VEAYFESRMINTDVDWLRLVQSLLKDHALEWWMAQKDVEPNLMGNLPWSTFKAKLNERFTPHNHILKVGQELLSFQQTWSNGKVCLDLCIITQHHSNEGVHTKMWFSYMALRTQCHLVKNWGPYNLSKDDEGYGVHGKWLHAQEGKNTTNFTTHHDGEYQKCSIGGPKRGQKRKWDKNPPTNKGILAKKKS